MYLKSLRGLKTIFKFTLFGGGAYGGSNAYQNSKSGPVDPKLYEQEKKRILVVGAGIVGLSTAYYLGEYQNNEVVLVEKNSRCAMESSV